MENIKRFHPGVYIKESLEAMEMTSREFSARTGISERTLSAIINGNGDITFDVAYKLSKYFDDSINFWINLQTAYNVYLREKNKKEELENEWNLVKKIKSYLIDLGYFDSINKKDYEIIVNECRKIVGVNSLTLLNVKDSFTCLKEQHTKNEVDYFVQNFWIALALKEAREKNNISYNRKLLIDSIEEIRKMTNQDPNIFYPRLKEIFDNCGVSFVLLPYLSKSNIYGATKWFSKDNVMLAISNRGEKADLFWFTLFHEISHVLMEHRRETLINMKGSDDAEADKMAANMLIPKKMWQEFLSTNIFTIDTIKEFASKVGIHPCIVTRRLHKERNEDVPYGKFDNCFGVSYKISISK